MNNQKNGRFLVAACAIVENTQTKKILLLKRSAQRDFCPDIWEYVTGRLHQFEDPETGLRREVMEETNLEVRIVKPISIFHIFRGKKIEENELVGVIYWCQTESEKVIISEEEHSEYRWVSAEEALTMMEIPDMKKEIGDFIRERG